MRVIFKKVEGQDSKKQKSVGCVVPTVGLGFLQSVMLDGDGQAWLQLQLEGLQDKIARDYVVKGSSAIRYEEIDSNAVLGWIRAQDVSADRFTKEVVAKWFSVVPYSYLESQIRFKMPDISASQLATLMNAYLVSFQSLAGRSPITDKVKKQLLRVIELIPEDVIEDDSIVLEIMRRLTEDRKVVDANALLDNL